MKILYDSKTKKIYATVKDADWFWFPVSFDGTHYWIMHRGDLTKVNVNFALDLLDLPETPVNKNQAIDMQHKLRKVDDSGDGKYTVDTGVVKEKANWVEKVDDNFSVSVIP